MPETYQWFLVPAQPDPKRPVEWAEIRQQGQESLAARAAKKLRKHRAAPRGLRNLSVPSPEPGKVTPRTTGARRTA